MPEPDRLAPLRQGDLIETCLSQRRESQGRTLGCSPPVAGARPSASRCARCVAREKTLSIETEGAPYGASEPCFGASDFFSSPNHWRILAIKLPIGSIIRPLRRMHRPVWSYYPPSFCESTDRRAIHYE
jgi:hypothetical protein